MNNATPKILFEHPLNEKMRTWLRIEFLLQQLESQRISANITNTLIFFRTLSNLIDVLERVDVRTELVKELEHQQNKLKPWVDVPGVDKVLINSLRSQLKDRSEILMSAPRIGQSLKANRFINLVRQRLSIPGSCCSFDLPALHMWLHLPQIHRDEDVNSWLKTLLPLNQAITSILDLIRKSDPFRNQISLNGFFQDNPEGAYLLRIQLSTAHQLYPQI